MLTVKLPHITYHRLLATNVTPELTRELKNDDYSFVISYGHFDDLDYSIVEKNAAIIDLANGIDNAFNSFNATARKHIRRFEKITELSFHSIITNKESFYTFYASAERSRNWYPVPPEELFGSLLFYVCYNGEPISGMSAYTHGNLMRLGRIFSTRNISELENSNLIYGVAAKKIVHEFCVYAINNGYQMLDLGGLDLSSDIKSGITEFKLSFTDKIVPVKIGRWCKTSYAQLQHDFLTQGLDLT